MQSQAYIVLDTETTGISPATDRVIEIAAVRIENRVVTGRFSTLIDPGVRIPYRITKLTGIANRDLVGAPSPADAWKEYLEFARDDVRVAHNAAFDRGFVASELARLGLPPERAPYLCTVRLSRRLLPGLPSKKLDSVARFLGVPVGIRHRALADAEITAEVLVRLADRAQRLGRGGASDLLGMQQSRYVSTRATSAHIEGILRDVIPGLPDGPGVYRFYDARRRLLYVGKAASLRRRVGSYFVGVESKPGRTRDLATRTRHVEVLETASEIEALLAEARLIRELQPPFNRALKRDARRAWLRVSGADSPVGTVGIRAATADDDAEWYGPLAGVGEAVRIAEILGAVFGLTVEARRPRTPYDRDRADRVLRAGQLVQAAADVGAVSPLDRVLSGCTSRAFLAGEIDFALSTLSAAMGDASAAFRFEEAAMIRDWSEQVRRLAEEPGPLVGHAGSTHTVRFLRRDDHLIAVLSRPARGVVVVRARDATELGAALEWGDRQPDTESVESERLVAQWAYRNRETVSWLGRVPHEAFEAFVARTVERALEHPFEKPLLGGPA